MGMRRTVAVVGVGIVFALSGCGGGGSDTDSGGAVSGGKYEQTWAKSYSDTTCSDFQSEMDKDQRRVAAADMLVSAQKVDGGDSLPSDDLIAEFASGLILIRSAASPPS